MHSRKANKREVLKSLEQALQLSVTSPIDADVPTKLAASRDKLNLWSSAIHRPIGKTARTVFDVIGRQVKLRSEGTRLLDCRLDDAAAWSAAKLSSVEVVVDRAGEAVSKLPVIQRIIRGLERTSTHRVRSISIGSSRR